jgi:hypothetical protein
MKVIEHIFKELKNNKYLSAFILLPIYFFRYVYHSIVTNSLWFYRHYPGHYSSTIPSTKYIKKNRDRLFKSHDNNDGVNFNEKYQKELLTKFSQYFQDFTPPCNQSPDKLYYYNNSMYGFNDAFILYCFLREYEPKRVIEVGSGFSSALMLDVSNEILSETHFTFIDPYSTTIRNILKSNPSGKYNLIKKEIQNIDVSTYSELSEDDILFIDSSHVIKIGSDLSSLLYSVLPSLQNGVIVHIHDIWYPFEYPEKMLNEGRAWNEIYLIRAFLQYNSSFQILFYNSFVEGTYRDLIDRNMPGYFKDSGKSLWLRKIAQN